jgi:hypothetical protein
MVIARIIGWPVAVVGGIILALLGVVLLIVGVASSPANWTLVIIGAVLIVVGALFFLDGLAEREAARQRARA